MTGCGPLWGVGLHSLVRSSHYPYLSRACVCMNKAGRELDSCTSPEAAERASGMLAAVLAERRRAFRHATALSNQTCPVVPAQTCVSNIVWSSADRLACLLLAERCAAARVRLSSRGCLCENRASCHQRSRTKQPHQGDTLTFHCFIQHFLASDTTKSADH